MRKLGRAWEQIVGTCVFRFTAEIVEAISLRSDGSQEDKALRADTGADWKSLCGETVWREEIVPSCCTVRGMSNEVSVSGVLNVETSSVREIRPSGVLKHWRGMSNEVRCEWCAERGDLQRQRDKAFWCVESIGGA